MLPSESATGVEPVPVIEPGLSVESVAMAVRVVCTKGDVYVKWTSSAGCYIVLQSVQIKEMVGMDERDIAVPFALGRIEGGVVLQTRQTMI